MRPVRDVLRNLDPARDMYHRYGSLSESSLTASTGAGKTVKARLAWVFTVSLNSHRQPAGSPAGFSASVMGL